MSPRLKDFYLTLDLRSLGTYRILLALLLIHDWCVRWPDLEAFYTSAGFLPIEASVPRVGGVFHFSLLDPLTSLPLVRLAFLLGLTAYVLLLLGWQTKLAQIASFLFFSSVRTRNPLISQGGDVVLVTMALWTLFLPLGARFSVDAVRAALRRGVPLRCRTASPVGPPPVSGRSLAAFAVVFQIGLVYLGTAAAKTGVTWRDGTAVYYTLQLDLFATPLGQRLGLASLGLQKALTWGVLGLEILALPLFLLPVAQPWLRRGAILGLAGFHLGTFFTLAIGSFPFVMLATFALLLLPADWDVIGRWLSRAARPVVAYYDDTCGFCHRCCQVLALADRAGRIRFIGNTDRAAFAHPVTAEEVQSSLVVFDATSGRKTTRSAAVAALLGALPLPFQGLRGLALPGLVALSDRGYDFVARNRYRLSERMGYTACGVDRVAEDVPAAAPPPRAAPARRTLRLGIEVVVAYLLLATVLDSWNQSLAARIGGRPVRMPAWTRAPILGFDLVQGWRMFAPDPFRGDGWWVADAEPAAGVHVDLLTGRPTVWEKPRHLATSHNVFWRAYLFNVSQPRYHAYRLAYARWLVHRAEQRGAPRPVRFGFYYIQEDTQPPGSPRPFPLQQFLLWEYDAQHDAIVPAPGTG